MTTYIFRRAFSVLFLLGMILYSTAICQVDSILGFFPLHIGDVHQYNFHYSFYPGCSYSGGSSYQTETILGDTTLPTGFQYKIIANGSSVRYVRIDTATTCVFTYSDYPSPHDYLSDSLRINIGGVFNEGTSRLTQCIGIDTVPILGVQTIVKHFQVSTLPTSYYSLAYGFGLVQDVYYQDDPCYPVLDGYYRDIVFAKINGQEFGTLVSVGKEPSQILEHFVLEQNYPNPFNPSTTFQFFLPHSEYVSFNVFNQLGQVVAVLLSKEMSQGTHQVQWKPINLAAGVYYCRLQAGLYIETKKIILLQ